MVSANYIVMILVLAAQISESKHANHSPQESNSAEAHAENMEPRAFDGAPMIGHISDTLSSLNAIADRARPTSSLNREDLPSQPATFVWARISKEYLADFVERDVDRTKPKRDCILGTTIVGESRTMGNTRLVLHSNEDHASGELEFVGKVSASTTGRNGPARFRFLSNSTFNARKSLFIDDAGLRSTAATAHARTHLTATDIWSTLPRLRGRIAERIASRRWAQSRSRANAIASDHTADDIRRGLDGKLDERVAIIQTAIRAQIAALKRHGEQHALQLRSRSTPGYIEVAVCHPSERKERVPMPTFAVDGNPDIAIRVHRTFLTRALSDEQLRQTLAPYMGILAQNYLVGGIDKAGKPPLGLTSTNWAFENEWLSMDLIESKDKSPRIALEGTTQEKLR